MDPRHAETVRTSFTGQAGAFEDGRFVGALVRDGEWIFRRLELRPDQRVLDVAAGTGHAARGLAPFVGSVVAVDATPAMLEAGRAAALAEGLDTVEFIEGDAAALPFDDDAFDVVVCRFAVHHFPDPDAVLAEMVRCARPGGQLLVADLVADEDPAVAAAQNALEIQRDPSHTRCLSAAELGSRVTAHGGVDAQTDLHQTVRPLGPWLEQTDTPPAAAAAIRLALQAEIDDGRRTGLRPHTRDGELWFEQRFAAVTARAPS